MYVLISRELEGNRKFEQATVGDIDIVEVACSNQVPPTIIALVRMIRYHLVKNMQMLPSESATCTTRFYGHCAQNALVNYMPKHVAPWL